MYNAQYSNNPFIDDPTNTSNRYPDINTLERTGNGFSSPAPTFGASPSFGSSAGYPGYAGSQGYGSQGYGIQQQQPQFQFQQQQQQSPSGWPQQGLASPYAAGTGGYGANPISPQMTGLPYQNGFGAQQYGQQQQRNSGYGQSYPNSQYGGYSGYSGQQGPQQQTQYLSEFDPLQVRINTTTIALQTPFLYLSLLRPPHRLISPPPTHPQMATVCILESTSGHTSVNLSNGTTSVGSKLWIHLKVWRLPGSRQRGKSIWK